MPITFQLKIRYEVRRIMRGHHHGCGVARAEPSHGSSFEKAQHIVQQADAALDDNPDRRRLMTVPGVGPITALTILAEAGNLRRFAHYRQFLKFCGMSLSTQQSGRFHGQNRLSKYGNARQRTAFWMAAQSAVRMRENSLRRKFDRYVRANPLDPDLRRRAYSAVAAKLARIVR